MAVANFLAVLSRLPRLRLRQILAMTYNDFMTRQYYVYILSNYNRNVLYTGFTNNLLRRVWEHKQGIIEGFTKKYHVHDLLYYEMVDNPTSAIAREKQIKSWPRERKEKLILTMNTKKEDLYSSLFEVVQGRSPRTLIESARDDD